MLYLVSEDKNVLMIEKSERKNDPNSGYFTLPGGKLKDNEKGLNYPHGRLEACIRETKEETGIEPLDLVLKGIILFDNKERTFPNWPNPDNFLVYIFATTKFKGKPKETNEGRPKTVPLNKVDKVPSNPGDRKMYEWLKDGRKFMGVIKHKGNEIDKAGTFVNYL